MNLTFSVVDSYACKTGNLSEKFCKDSTYAID
ncbi:hypothetical protein Galf_1893 [Gallionella capsiferriformans ES-2]|uniref:Uncharacterized protein n=1 Tax=Gallionella capsiferriformans (strain ES-2) TaxID=395494 RepID=D9SHA4_GALCS|nr:hypothetical protein Galf_1893 [Gallionella capsiferriformans ES-2]